MISLPRTDIIIPFAILHQALPYTYKCSCSTPLLPPSKISLLSIIIEGDEFECQECQDIPTPTKIQPSIPSEVSVHPPSSSNLHMISTTFDIPNTSISQRPPCKPPYLSLLPPVRPHWVENIKKHRSHPLWHFSATMVSAASAVLGPGRPPALHPATCHAPPVHSTSFTSKNNHIQQEMMVYPTNSPSSTHGTVRALRNHPSFFASFAPTP